MLPGDQIARRSFARGPESGAGISHAVFGAIWSEDSIDLVEADPCPAMAFRNSLGLLLLPSSLDLVLWHRGHLALLARSVLVGTDCRWIVRTHYLIRRLCARTVLVVPGSLVVECQIRRHSC